MRFLILLFALLTSLMPAAAQDWALEGYDPVGYLAQGQPIPGRSDIATMWQGQIWHFASEENRARFEADPRVYAPGFAGNCPVALSEGRVERGDPRNFIIYGNRLYLMRSVQALRQMQQNAPDVLEKARTVWKTKR